MSYKVGTVFQRPTSKHFPCWSTFRSLSNFFCWKMSVFLRLSELHIPTEPVQEPSQEWLLQLSAVFFGVSLLSPEAEDMFLFTLSPSQLEQFFRYLLQCLLLLRFFCHLRGHMFSSLTHTAIFSLP